MVVSPPLLGYWPTVHYLYSGFILIKALVPAHVIID